VEYLLELGTLWGTTKRVFRWIGKLKCPIVFSPVPLERAGLLSGETAIVFTTAHFEYAVESYSFNTIDYLLKPITLRRFLATTKKIETYFRPRMPVTAKEDR
jgi:hypothetical protein